MACLAYGGGEIDGLLGDGLSVTGTPTRDTSTKYGNGAASLKFTAAGQHLALPAPTTRAMIQMRLYLTAYPAADMEIIHSDQAAANRGQCVIKTDGKVRGLSGANVSTLTVPLNQWFTLQYSHTKDGSNIETIIIDGTQYCSGSSGQSGLGNAWRIGMVSGGGSCDLYIDDYIVNDGSGASDTGYPDLREVVRLATPTSDGSIGADWAYGDNTAISGSGYNAINNQPPVGLSAASATPSSQLRYNNSGSTHTADFNTPSYDTAAGELGGIVRATRVVVNGGDNSGGLNAVFSYKTQSNPAGTSTNHTTGATNIGTFPTGWTWGTGAIDGGQSLAGTSVPVIRLGPRAGGSAGAMWVDFAGILFRYLPTQEISTGQALEADTAQPVTWVRRRLAGQALETDTAQTVTPYLSGGGTPQTVVIGQATETDTANTARPVRVHAVGQATETDTATAVAYYKTASLGQALETDTATALVTQKTKAIGQALETDTAQTVTPAKLLYPDTLDNGGGTVYGPTIQVGQLLEPADVIDAVVGLVFPPEMDLRDVLSPDFFSMAPVVYGPALALGEEVLPTRVDNTSTVYDPALEQGTAIAPDFFSLTSNVRSPRLIQGQLISPANRIDLASTVFAPRLIQGQFISPNTIPAGTTTVFSPQLIPGQFLNPDFWIKPAATIYSPAVQLGQPLNPDLLTNSPETVYDPTLIEGQLLYPGTPNSAGTPTVFDPAIALIPPVVIDPDTDDEVSWRSGIRTAR